MNINLDDLTLGQIKKLQSLLACDATPQGSIFPMIGKYVIIRTYSAGVWCGYLSQKDGKEVILTKARRMWRWWAAESISLSAVAIYGIKQDESKIVEPVESVWLEQIEIIPCTVLAQKSLEDAPNVKAE